MATVNLTIDSFGKAVDEHGIVLVDFWAAWCGPCRAFAPVFEKASEAHTDIVFGKVDTEAEQELAAAARITSIPTLIAFREQVLVFSQPGALNGPQLEQLIGAIEALDMDEVRRKLEPEPVSQA
ncbi:thioredoxin [soil metagenome]